MKLFYKPLLLVLFYLLCLQGLTQDTLSISAAVDKNRILIGEPITLTLSVRIPSQEPIRFFQLDTIRHFEILDRGKIDTSDNRDAVQIVQELKLTSFDSGSWVLPSYVIAGSALMTDSFPIEVSYTASFDPKQDYRDIKDILTLPPVKEKPWYQRYSWVGAVVLLLLIFLIWRATRKKTAKAEVTLPEKDPYKVALEKLAALRPGQSDRKLFHSRVVEVFRVYLKNAKGIESLQQTTDDLVRQLKGLSMNEAAYSQLSDALRMTDLVKFAKHETEESDDRFVLNTIKESIAIIEGQSGSGTSQQRV